MALRIVFHCCLILALGNWSCRQDTPNQTDTATTPTDTAEVASPEVIVFDSSLYNFKNGELLLDWPTLAQIDFEERFNEEIQGWMMYPIFKPIVKALHKQRVRVRGFVIPVDETGDEQLLVLSAYPYSNCFFCGAAGPESVMEIRLKATSKRFRMDTETAFAGTFLLNDTDINSLNYILADAEWVK
ncbi:MAG TPA: hypothetical protein PKD70_07785 [Saprospiraceae bacterium]|nr:hypothetical protein [Saprospiraceae bacterium]